ncbi:uncharacterized protein LOC115415498 [Sphaeramia orbicularis]|uniref:uncharacterized protein LOC115415498 n=1 Tax=Sphaeramia orbicularis TaxID=375764 RepID=UPI00117CE4F1|nr:uncharacterized protein LOC115415498 [Sphaeramia orbicularis]
MMVENKQIKMSFSLLLMLQITVEAGTISSVVRRGDDAMLSCANLNVHDCGQIGFIYIMDTYRTELVQRGQIKNNGKVTTDRLRMTANCSLVIKEVIPEDAGLYYCQQNHHQQVEYTENWLSVVSINEHEAYENVALTCSVSTYVQCKHPVKWLYEENEVTKNNKNIRLSQDICWSTVTFKKSINTESFTCKVEDKNTGNIHLFPIRPRSSDEENKMNVETTRVTPTTRMTTKLTTVKNSEDTMTTSAPGYYTTKPVSGFPDWAKFPIASGLAALLVTTVVLLIWKIKKGNKTQMGEGTVADPEDAVPYASVHFTKKARKAGAQRKNDDDDDDDDDAVTYSTVKASSSSAADSCDPSILYVTVNKPK